MKSCCDNGKLVETKTEGTSRKIMSRHEKKAFLVATDNGCRDQEGMLDGLVRSLPGNLRLQQKYKLETLIEVATRNSCRYIKLS